MTEYYVIRPHDIVQIWAKNPRDASIKVPGTINDVIEVGTINLEDLNQYEAINL